MSPPHHTSPLYLFCFLSFFFVFSLLHQFQTPSMEPSRFPSSIPLLLLIFLMFSCTFCGADVNQDKQKCSTQLVGLVGCLSYVSGDPKAKSPTPDCCSGLKSVLANSKECLCILIKDRDDPSLRLKINVTLALGLPDKCQTPANISDCPALLHLPPNSPDAKVFTDYGKSGNGSTTLTPSVASSAGTGPSPPKNGGAGKRMSWLRNEMVLGLLMIVALIVSPNS